MGMYHWNNPFHKFILYYNNTYSNDDFISASIVVYSKPLEDENANEEFVDLAEAYYVAKLSIRTVQSSLRHELMEPRLEKKKVEVNSYQSGFKYLFYLRRLIV